MPGTLDRLGVLELSTYQRHKDCIQRGQGKATLIIATDHTAIICLHLGGATIERRRRAREIVDDDGRDLSNPHSEVRTRVRRHFDDGVHARCQWEQDDAIATHLEHRSAVDLELGVARQTGSLTLRLRHPIDRDDRAAVTARTEEFDELDLTRRRCWRHCGCVSRRLRRRWRLRR